MVSRRCVRWVAPLFVACSLFACNALLGNEEERRVDDAREAGSDRQSADVTTEGSSDAPTSDEQPIPPPDSGPDAKITINVVQNFTSPNDASFGPADGGVGTTIYGYTGAANHPVILPLQQPTIPSDDYTVEAIVRAPTSCEFGILTRVQPDGAGQLLGSHYGGEPKPFIGNIGPTGWGPTLDSSGLVYTFTSTRYFMKVQAIGARIEGKIWKGDLESEPKDPQAGIINAKYKTGRGVGFYVYFCYTAALESMKVTVP